MFFLYCVKNIDDHRISLYRSLKGKNLAKDGIFIAEGQKVVEALLNSNLQILSVLVTKEWFKRLKQRFNKRSEDGLRVYIIGKKEIERLIGFTLHQGVMAAAKAPPKLSLKQAARLWRSERLILAINGIRDAENIGLIVRNCFAFGVDTIIVDRASSDPYLRRAVRVSMGAIFRLSVIYVESLWSALEWLKKKCKTRIIAASPGRKNKDLSKLNFSGNICLVFGSEVHGISDKGLEVADSVVRIPISKEIDSLNVSCASAIVLYQAMSRRNGKCAGRRIC